MRASIGITLLSSHLSLWISILHHFLSNLSFCWTKTRTSLFPQSIGGTKSSARKHGTTPFHFISHSQIIRLLVSYLVFLFSCQSSLVNSFSISLCVIIDSLGWHYWKETRSSLGAKPFFRANSRGPFRSSRDQIFAFLLENFSVKNKYVVTRRGRLFLKSAQRSKWGIFRVFWVKYHKENRC